jgi:hypothetical protein
METAKIMMQAMFVAILVASAAVCIYHCGIAFL